VPCVNQCYNCTNSTYCLSCITGYSLNPDKKCLTTCPDGYSSVSSICVLCTSNCLTCSSTPSTCTKCANPYFLTGSSCVQTCPDTFYGSNNLCLTCINQCYNCTS
jgi:proprotein convertase subtilisin/kexin type 5